MKRRDTGKLIEKIGPKASHKIPEWASRSFLPKRSFFLIPKDPKSKLIFQKSTDWITMPSLAPKMHNPNRVGEGNLGPFELRRKPF